MLTSSRTRHVSTARLRRWASDTSAPQAPNPATSRLCGHLAAPSNHPRPRVSRRTIASSSGPPERPSPGRSKTRLEGRQVCACAAHFRPTRRWLFAMQRSPGSASLISLRISWPRTYGAVGLRASSTISLRSIGPSTPSIPPDVPCLLESREFVRVLAREYAEGDAVSTLRRLSVVQGSGRRV